MRPESVKASVAITLAGVLSFSGVARAQTETKDWDGDYGTRAEHRSDFTFGTSGGLLFGSAVGYPNESDKIDVPEFEADTGMALGNGGTLWLGGALRDTLTLNVGLSGGSLYGGGLEGSLFAFVFRLEAFPLFYQTSFGKDLGVSAQFGAGGARLLDGDTDKADGGNMASVGGGLFYELWHFGGFAAGPSLDYTHLFSASLTAHTVSLGGRIAFYGGP